jgi:spore coat protein U-like protein
MPAWSGPYRALAALALALAAQHAAAGCTASAQGVAFGAYNPLSGAAVDGVGNVAVSCDVATAYTVALSPGSGSYAARTMTSGAHRLGYNLYVDATRAVVWGDGTAGSAAVPGLGTAANHTVYGRIPGIQNVDVGSYTDTITITLTF